MTMAAVMENRAATGVRSGTSRIASVDIIDDLGRAEPVWRRLEQTGQFCTPYQRFDLAGAWQRHVGAREGIAPFIVAAYDREGQPLLLLPLGVKREHGVRVAR